MSDRLMKQPLKLRQAKHLSRTFQQLKGLMFFIVNRLTHYTIIDVIVVPYDSVSRTKALMTYKKTRSQAEALATYKGKEFDVVIITDDPHFSVETCGVDVRTYMNQRGMPIDMKYYTSLFHRYFM